MLQIRKVIEHVYEKILLPLGTVPQPSLVTPTGDDGAAPAFNAAELSTLASERVELLCNDQVRRAFLLYFEYTALQLCNMHLLIFPYIWQLLDASLDLRTVKHIYWKSGGDLTLMYRLKAPAHARGTELHSAPSSFKHKRV